MGAISIRSAFLNYAKPLLKCIAPAMQALHFQVEARELLLIFLFIKYGEDWFAELENLPLFSKNKSYIVIWYFYITENLNERANNK